MADNRTSNFPFGSEAYDWERRNSAQRESLTALMSGALPIRRFQEYGRVPVVNMGNPVSDLPSLDKEYSAKLRAAEAEVDMALMEQRRALDRTLDAAAEGKRRREQIERRLTPEDINQARRVSFAAVKRRIKLED